jgi:hypothetical protein
VKGRCALVPGAKPPIGILAERVMRRFGDGSLLRLVKRDQIAFSSGPSMATTIRSIRSSLRAVVAPPGR